MSNQSPASMSIGKILALLTPGQAWSFVAAMLVVVAGAFTFGLKISGFEVDRLKDDQAKLQRQITALENRRKFFTAYTEFLIARQKEYEQYNCNAQMGRSQAAAMDFAKLIASWYYAADSNSGNLPTYEPGTAPVVRKGSEGVNDSNLVFPDGGDHWTIPGVVKQFVLDMHDSQGKSKN